MKQNKPKYKIIQQSKENVWGTYKYKQKFQTKKWSRLKNKLDRPPRFIFRKHRKPHSLKIMKKQRLLNKQKFKSFYGHLSSGYLKKEYQRIQQKESIHIIDHLRIRLEQRVDILLFRSGVYSSIFQAQQAVKHQHIRVNGQFITNSTYTLQPGDFIQLISNHSYKSFNNLPYAQINSTLGLLILLRSPKITEITYPFNFYSKYLSDYLNKH